MTRNDCKKAIYQMQIFWHHPQIGKSMKNYIQAFLWISLDRIIVQAPSISHFKGLGMRNLEYEIVICQKIHNKVTITMSMLSRFFWNRRYVPLNSMQDSGQFCSAIVFWFLNHFNRILFKNWFDLPWEKLGKNLCKFEAKGQLRIVFENRIHTIFLTC